MKKQTLKAIGIVFIGLLIWNAFIYLGIAFIKAEANAFMWSERARGVMFLTNFMYLAGIPLFINELKDWL